MKTLGKLPVIFEHVDLDAGVFVGARLIGVEPEARPYPRTLRQLGTRFEIPVALGKAGAVRMGRGKQTRAPFVVGAFARFDPQDAVAQGERKRRLGVGKGRIAEIAAPGGMSEPTLAILRMTGDAQRIEVFEKNRAKCAQIKRRPFG